MRERKGKTRLLAYATLSACREQQGREKKKENEKTRKSEKKKSSQCPQRRTRRMNEEQSFSVFSNSHWRVWWTGPSWLRTEPTESSHFFLVGLTYTFLARRKLVESHKQQAIPKSPRDYFFPDQGFLFFFFLRSSWADGRRQLKEILLSGNGIEMVGKEEGK